MTTLVPTGMWPPSGGHCRTAGHCRDRRIQSQRFLDHAIQIRQRSEISGDHGPVQIPTVVLLQLLEQPLLHCLMAREQIQTEGHRRSGGIVALKDEGVYLIADLVVGQRLSIQGGMQQSVQQCVTLVWLLILVLVSLLGQSETALLYNSIGELMKAVDACSLFLESTGPAQPKELGKQKMRSHEPSGQDVRQTKRVFKIVHHLGIRISLGVHTHPHGRFGDDVQSSQTHVGIDVYGLLASGQGFQTPHQLAALPVKDLHELLQDAEVKRRRDDLAHRVPLLAAAQEQSVAQPTT
ncbi:hypothetical protein M5D96_012937 [Drosophila gunungcola]|uniref:Uncharacterized protein n=1 Tax=Drosophila gunungcola TaxID=103775 RepID=A0A9P9YCA9_9MUSC|nr:hypothetical protein M5D96_012937 [Drosophila gunungcola]